MSTSNVVHPGSTRHRGPLRLRLTEEHHRHRLDGAWWPQSRSLAIEVADLVDHFPAGRGRIARVLISPPDWDAGPRRIPVAGGYVKVGSFPRDDTHLIQLKTLGGAVLFVLVVPPHFDRVQGWRAMHAAEHSREVRSGTALLHDVELGREVVGPTEATIAAPEGPAAPWIPTQLPTRQEG